MGKFDPREITAAEVRAYREETGASMDDAKKALSRHASKEAFARLRAEGTLEEKIEFLLDRFEGTL